MSKIARDYAKARKAAHLTQQEVATHAGISRMALQKLEAGTADPRLSTLEVVARALGMELMLVPASLRDELKAFIQAGGKLVGLAAGVSAPKSVVDRLTERVAQSEKGGHG
jgi:transcriptional regulator with XRE-family HTH domain